MPERSCQSGNANLRIGEGKSAEREGANAEIGVPGYKRANAEIGVPGGGWGWYSRGYLPHFHGREVMQHVTFHLADSLPRHVVQRLDDELRMVPPEKQDAERRMRVEALIDAGHGACVLRDPAVAAMVQGALLHFDGERYRLLAWVVMPNHVHVVFQPLHEWTVAKIVGSWKKFTATRIRQSGNANLRIGEDNGPVWHREYWDRYIRDDRHFRQVVAYVQQNPVKAGLVATAEEWRWGSAALVLGNAEVGVTD